MGFEIDRFESPVDPDFACRLCGKVLEDPLTTPCGHVFCAGCVISWVDEQSSCPVKCQRISRKDLNHELPMKNLILKLDIRCVNYTRGCKGVQLQHLSNHAELCDFSSVKCRNKGCNAVLSLIDMDSHMREKCEYRPTEICNNGCGLMLNLKEKLENHSCLVALRTQNCVLQGELNSLEGELRRQTIRSSNRERSLLAQLSTAHCELQITALRYQKKLTAYKARIDALSNNWVPLCKGEETRRFTVTLHRSSGSLGFNITGGRSCAWSDSHGDFSDGIYVSKIMDNGPADIGGLQTYDRIIKVNAKDISVATHDEAVEAFSMARGLIEVEVVRRVAPARTANPLPSNSTGVDASTQTGSSLAHKETMVGGTFSATSLGMTMLDNDYRGQAEGRGSSHGSASPRDSFEGQLKASGQGELYYKQVGLQRMTTQDELPLALCCMKDEEDETGIYVSEDNGRLRKEQNSLRDDFPTAVLEQQHHRALRFSDSLLRQRGKVEDGCAMDTVTVVSNPHEKDSGVGRTDDSTRNGDRSYQENQGEGQTSNPDPSLSPCRSRGSSRGDLTSRPTCLGGGCFLSVDGVESPGEPEPESLRFRETLDPKRPLPGAAPSTVVGAASCGNTLHSDCEEQVQMLNEEPRAVELECLSITRAYGQRREARGQPSHTDDGSAAEQQGYSVPGKTDKETSSAYNTGDSSTSSSPALEVPSDTALFKGTDVFPRSSKHTLSPVQETIHTKRKSPSTEPRAANQGKGNGLSGKNVPASPLYSPYRQVHIPVHAQHYSSYMQLVQQRVAVEYAQSEDGRGPRGSPEDGAPKVERRVKIRNDGTRYMTERPAREERLRERALRLRQERCSTTTDEEAASGLQTGRYWSREERTRHASRARMRWQGARRSPTSFSSATR